MKEVDKVVAYIYRDNCGVKELLVFDHPNHPEVNPQVPAGTLQSNEVPETGVLREVLEESGLKFSKSKNYLGCFDFDATIKGELHKRHVFEFDIPIVETKESWSHIVKSDDEDCGEQFDYYWLPLKEAKEKLLFDFNKYLPTINGHVVKASDIESKWFNEDLKVGGLNCAFSNYFGLNQVAAHYFKIPPGYRTSEPHAEKLEEEFVFVLSGEIDLWLNGKIKTMKKGDCIGFAAGTGIGHCFINNSRSDCEIFVAGDRTKSDNQYHFHLDPSLEKECGDKWWSDMPKQTLGEHNGLPGEFPDSYRDDSIETLNAFESLSKDACYYPGDTEELTHDACLSRPFKMKSIAVWLEKLPAGNRASWPHAHLKEEEFLFVVEGEPHIWLNGQEFQIGKFDGVDFKPGSGVAHTVVNKSSKDVYYICVGECEAEGDKIYYPQHPARNEEMRKRGSLWEEMVKE